jgi:predicted acyl esterase
MQGTRNPPPNRPDVLTYQTEILKARVRISGAPIADLSFATTGTDSDWVVKLIDVFPDEVPSRPEMGGYQLSISMDIFRGRYRQSFEAPSAVPSGVPERYRFVLLTANHVFLPAHNRDMLRDVQPESNPFMAGGQRQQAASRTADRCASHGFRPIRCRRMKQSTPRCRGG